jgi:hypothetical protein
MNEQLDFDVIAEPIPEWAAACYYCWADEFGHYDEARHLANDLPKTCPVCHETSPNTLLYEMNHGINLGASYQRGALLCLSLSLRLNHLDYDASQGRDWRERDKTALDLGWSFGDDGELVAPEGWPPAPGREATHG